MQEFLFSFPLQGVTKAIPKKCLTTNYFVYTKLYGTGESWNPSGYHRTKNKQSHKAKPTKGNSRIRGNIDKTEGKKAYFTPHSYLLCPYFLRSTSDPIRPCFVGLVSDLSRRRVGGGTKEVKVMYENVS